MTRSWPNRGGISRTTAITIVVAVCAVAFVGYRSWSRSVTDLLDAETLTPAQIRRIATRLVIHEDIEIQGKARERLLQEGAAAVPVLKDLGLTHSDQRVREGALDLLTELDAGATAQVLEQMIDDESADLRRLATRTALRLNHRSVKALLLKAVEDDDAGVRLAAMDGCAVRRVLKAVPALKRSLDDPRITVRRHAARALHSLTGRRYTVKVDRRPP